MEAKGALIEEAEKYAESSWTDVPYGMDRF
jgi:hypothetical protein